MCEWIHSAKLLNKPLNLDQIKLCSLVFPLYRWQAISKTTHIYKPRAKSRVVLPFQHGIIIIFVLLITTNTIKFQIPEMYTYTNTHICISTYFAFPVLNCIYCINIISIKQWISIQNRPLEEVHTIRVSVSDSFFFTLARS